MTLLILFDFRSTKLTYVIILTPELGHSDPPPPRIQFKDRTIQITYLIMWRFPYKSLLWFSYIV